MCSSYRDASVCCIGLTTETTGRTDVFYTDKTKERQGTDRSSQALRECEAGASHLALFCESIWWRVLQKVTVFSSLDSGENRVFGSTNRTSWQEVSVGNLANVLVRPTVLTVNANTVKALKKTPFLKPSQC